MAMATKIHGKPEAVNGYLAYIHERRERQISGTLTENDRRAIAWEKEFNRLRSQPAA